MDITIDGKSADITLDTEKTIGDVLSGIEQWLAVTGNRIKKISINGEISPDDLAEIFDREIKDVTKLDITLSYWRELAAEALADLRETCALFGAAAFEERPLIVSAWEKSAARRFMASDISDMDLLAAGAFSGEGLSPQDLAVLVEERLREAADPGQEIARSEALVNSITQRMEDLPLDIQTGKDRRATETVQLFSGIGEKLFRIFFIYKSEGLSPDTFIIDGMPVRVFVDEFNSALLELSAAYENRDSVLAGDIAEYELAPRLLKFFTALKNITKSGFRLTSLT